ncbi:MAG: hypothetical protein LBJ18_04475 [Rickettsiales bacterium]|jgi:hypothetical protein|nr:hypothetical protein [Rickettsiales bacterium]
MSNKLKIFALAGLSLFASHKANASDNDTLPASPRPIELSIATDKDTSTVAATLDFIASLRSPEKINEDSIYNLPPPEREKTILEMRAGNPRVEIDTIPASRYKKLFAEDNMVICQFQEELNRISLLQFDMSDTKGLSAGEIKYLEALNRETLLTFWHEYKHFLDRLRKNLGGCNAAQTVQYEVLYEMLGELNRLLVGRAVWYETGRIGAAFPELTYKAALEYSLANKQFKWQDFDPENIPYLLTDGAIKKYFGPDALYIKYLADNPPRKDSGLSAPPLDSAEVSILVQTIVQTAATQKNFYLEKQLSQGRLEIDLRDKFFALKSNLKTGTPAIVGYDELANAMFSDCYAEGGLNLLNMCGQKERTVLFDFVKECASEKYIMERAAGAEQGFGNAVAAMSKVQTQMGINPGNAKLDVFCSPVVVQSIVNER